MAFQDSTRRKFLPLATISKGSTNPLIWDLPRAGILAGIMLYITATVTGTLSAPNAYGAASIIKRVRVIANAGPDIINISGPGYHYLLRQFIEDYKDPVPHSTARSAVTATTFNLSMFLPIAINSRDPVGLYMLQNEQTLVQLSVEWETDAIVATGATVAGSITPVVEFFTVPVDPRNWPDFRMVHAIIEESRAVSAAGDVEYSWPRGPLYLGIYHGLGFGASGSDLWSSLKWRVNKGDYIGIYDVNTLSLEYTRSHGVARLAGIAPIDLMGSSGLGQFGSSRDCLASGLVTELDTVITATGAGTLTTMRRVLIPLA